MSARCQPDVTTHKRGSRAPVTQTSPQQENLTANPAGDRRSTAARHPSDIVLAYRVNDAVKVLGISRTSIYKLIDEGRSAQFWWPDGA